MYRDNRRKIGVLMGLVGLLACSGLGRHNAAIDQMVNCGVVQKSGQGGLEAVVWSTARIGGVCAPWGCCSGLVGWISIRANSTASAEHLRLIVPIASVTLVAMAFPIILTLLPMEWTEEG